jgi:hypothetical protein
MSGTREIPKCRIESCNKTVRLDTKGHIKSSFCTTHVTKATINAYLYFKYNNMKARVEGKSAHNRGHWKGKPILPRDVFMQWAKNHPDFLSLYKRYVMHNFDIKLAPSVNRIDSNKGYTLDNMEWITNSQNCSLAGTVRKMNNKERKVIYQVLGVTK